MKTLQVRIPLELMKNAKHYAITHDTSLKDIVIKALEQYLSGKHETIKVIQTLNHETNETNEVIQPIKVQESEPKEIIKDDAYYESRGIDWKVLSRKQTDGKPLTEFEQEAKDYDFEKFMKKVRAVEQQEAERLKLKAQQEQEPTITKDKAYYESKGISWNDIRQKHSSGFPLTPFEQEAYDFDDAEYEKRRKEWKPDTEPYCPPNPFDAEYYDYDMSTGKTVKRDAPPEGMEDLHK